MKVFLKEYLLLTVIVLQVLGSCKTISSFLHEGMVVAQVYGDKLYSSDISAYIPDGASKEDSTRLALQFIESWASERLFQKVADNELSKSEKDVSLELEEYRRSLLKYRYEQQYVNQRLDTTVTKAQIEKYYESHPESFVLNMPIIRGRFLKVSKDSPYVDVLKKKMASDKPEDLVEADSLAFISALKYTDFGGKWINIVTLSREFGSDYSSLISALHPGMVEKSDSNGIVNAVYVLEMMTSGQRGPLEYYVPIIKDNILSLRKQSLLAGLERDLLEKARNTDKFVIY